MMPAPALLSIPAYDYYLLRMWVRTTHSTMRVRAHVPAKIDARFFLLFSFFGDMPPVAGTRPKNI